MTTLQMNVQMLSPSGSDCHASDNAALQVMATDIESSDAHGIDSYIEDTEYLNL